MCAVRRARLTEEEARMCRWMRWWDVGVAEQWKAEGRLEEELGVELVAAYKEFAVERDRRMREAQKALRSGKSATVPEATGSD